MAAGFRSHVARWLGGLSSGAGSGPIPPEPVPPGCVCPEYTRDPTLVNAFAQTVPPVDVAYELSPTLVNDFVNDVLTLNIPYTKSKTLVNLWHRGACE
jgi:hypothetical protein